MALVKPRFSLPRAARTSSASSFASRASGSGRAGSALATVVRAGGGHGVIRFQGGLSWGTGHGSFLLLGMASKVNQLRIKMP